MQIKKVAELEKYLPMPYVWLKVGLGVVIKFALGLFIWRHLGDWLSGSLLRAIVFGLAFVVTYIVFWSALVLKNNNPFSWLKEYWQRNVRGCTLACFRNDDGGVTQEVLDLKDIGPVILPILLLKLGGWFKSHGSQCLGPWGWSARFAGVEQGQIMVRLIDREGRAMPLPAPEVLQILRDELTSGSQAGGRWSGLLHSILVERQIYQTQINETWPKLVKAEDESLEKEWTIKNLVWYVTWLRKALTCVKKTPPPNAEI